MCVGSLEHEKYFPSVDQVQCRTVERRPAELDGNVDRSQLSCGFALPKRRTSLAGLACHCRHPLVVTIDKNVSGVETVQVKLDC